MKIDDIQSYFLQFVGSSNSGRFPWLRFSELFSESAVMHSQGQYVDLVTEALRYCSDQRDKQHLFNLLDMLLISLLEMIAGHNAPFEHEMSNHWSADKRFSPICWKGDTIAARLDFNNQLAGQYGLPKRRDRLLLLLKGYE